MVINGIKKIINNYNCIQWVKFVFFTYFYSVDNDNDNNFLYIYTHRLQDASNATTSSLPESKSPTPPTQDMIAIVFIC